MDRLASRVAQGGVLSVEEAYRQPMRYPSVNTLRRSSFHDKRAVARAWCPVLLRWAPEGVPQVGRLPECIYPGT